MCTGTTGNSEKQALLILDQVKYLLEDEVKFGLKLAEDRKIKLALLGVVLAFGLFKIQAIDKTITALYTESEAVAIAFWVSGVFAVVALLMSVVLLAKEDDLISRGLGWCMRQVLRFTSWLLSLTPYWEWSRNLDDTENVDPVAKFSAALVVLYGDVAETESLPASVGWVQQRIEEHRSAYTALAVKNRRVRRRLNLGTNVLTAAFIFVTIMFGLFVHSSVTGDFSYGEEATNRWSSVYEEERIRSRSSN